MPTTANPRQASSVPLLVARLIALAKAEEELMERLAEAVEANNPEKVFGLAVQLSAARKRAL